MPGDVGFSLSGSDFLGLGSGLQSLFTNETAITTAAGDSAENIAAINADASLQASQYTIDKQTELIQTIAIIMAIVILVFAILWFFK